MKNKMAAVFAKVPTATAGLALAIASLGWCWESGSDFQGHAQMIGALIGSLLLGLLLLKFLLNPALLKQDLSHHMSGSVVPTFSMAAMIIANNINHFNHTLALLLWLTAILWHIYFLVVFSYYRFKDFKFEQILPSWFIPPVGIVVAVVSFPREVSFPSEASFPNEVIGQVFSSFLQSGFQWVDLAHLLLLFGFLTYSILLPIMLYRYFIHSKLSDAEKPTTAVFAAPASLTLAGYLTITDHPNYLFVVVLGILALTMTLFIYASFSKLLRLPFSPAYSAFTFPLVIGATAMFKTSQYLLDGGYSVWLVESVEFIAYVELILATLMVAYVSLRYVGYFKQLGR